MAAVSESAGMDHFLFIGKYPYTDLVTRTRGIAMQLIEVCRSPWGVDPVVVAVVDNPLAAKSGIRRYLSEHVRKLQNQQASTLDGIRRNELSAEIERIEALELIPGLPAEWDGEAAVFLIAQEDLEAAMKMLGRSGKT